MIMRTSNHIPPIPSDEDVLRLRTVDDVLEWRMGLHEAAMRLCFEKSVGFFFGLQAEVHPG